MGAGGGRRARVAHPYKEGTPHRGLGDQSPRRDRDDRFAQGGIRSIGAPAGATSMPRWMWGWIGRKRGYEKIAANEGGHGRGHVVRDHGKEDERTTPTGGGGRTSPITRGCTLSHNRNHDSSGGIKSLREPFKMNRSHLIKAGCGGDWARLSSKPGSPTTLSKIFCRCAATVSCGQYEASRPDSLRTARQSVVGTERSVASCSILLNDLCMTPNLAQARSSTCRRENVVFYLSWLCPLGSGATVRVRKVRWADKYYPLGVARNAPCGG